MYNASELRFFFVHFLHFVGTSDTLSVQMTCLSAYMYRQISKCTDKTEALWGAIASPAPPPPPSGYASGAKRPSGGSVGGGFPPSHGREIF